jgi:hypothetical protein
MSESTRLLALRIALIGTGAIFIFGIYPLGIVWPSGWTWGHGHSHYFMMIVGVYATLGVFLLLASRNPMRTAASFGSRCGRASFMRPFWGSSLSVTRLNAVTWRATCRRCCSLRSFSECWHRARGRPPDHEPALRYDILGTRHRQ